MNLEWSAAPPKDWQLTVQEWYDTLPPMFAECNACLVAVSRDVFCILENTHCFRPTLVELKGEITGILKLNEIEIFVYVSKSISRTQVLIVEGSGNTHGLVVKGIGI